MTGRNEGAGRSPNRALVSYSVGNRTGNNSKGTSMDEEKEGRADERDFREIAQEIAAGFIGELEHDFEHLAAKLPEYADHPMYREIARYSQQYLNNGLSLEDQRLLEELANKKTNGMEETLEKINFALFQREIDKAFDMTESLVWEIENIPVCEDDAQVEYRRFNETFEQILYGKMFKPEREVRPLHLPYPETYMRYGGLLFELKRYDEAKAALIKGLHYNPLHFDLYAEYTESVKVTEEIEKYKEAALAGFDLAFRARNIARCYRNMAFYYADKELFEPSIACNTLSLRYEDSDNARVEMFYAFAKTGERVILPDDEEIAKCAEEYGFPLVPNKLALCIAFQARYYHAQRGETDFEKYFEGILSEMARDRFALDFLEETFGGPESGEDEKDGAEDGDETAENESG